MFLNFRKVVVSILFSLMILFMPIVISVPDISANCIVNEITVEQQVIQLNSYSVCESASEKAVKKTVKGEASLISKVAGFFIGSTICYYLYGFSLTLALGLLVLFKNVENKDISNTSNVCVIGVVSGFLFYFAWVIVSTIILNMQTVTANVMGFITWFEYSAYLILLKTFGSETFSLPIFTFLGWALGHIVQDWLFF